MLRRGALEDRDAASLQKRNNNAAAAAGVWDTQSQSARYTELKLSLVAIHGITASQSQHPSLPAAGSRLVSVQSKDFVPRMLLLIY